VGNLDENLEDDFELFFIIVDVDNLYRNNVILNYLL
jgi:hypothetical protein